VRFYEGHDGRVEGAEYFGGELWEAGWVSGGRGWVGSEWWGGGGRTGQT